MRKQSGFTLIELMIVVAIIGILAAIAVPAYQDYVVRSQVSEGLTLAAGAKTGIAENFAQTGTPPATRVAAGLTANATDTAGQFVQSLQVTNGEIVITYGVNANARIAGGVLVLTPYAQPDNSLAWQCGGSTAGQQPGGVALAGPTAGTIPPELTPAQCRP